ncbi:MAG: hypothetical protein L3J69_18155 [Desulfobacula sp.]|nr:hypothetical protein [Desulfobacula sp.]
MGEIVGGIIVMIIFIGFIMLKNKGQAKKQDEMSRIHEEQYWAQKDSEITQVVSSDGNDDGGDD